MAGETMTGIEEEYREAISKWIDIALKNVWVIF